jgi:malonyl CoA-acyl carrier protein transacylase
MAHADYPVDPNYAMSLVLEIAGERGRQITKWSDCQNLPDGTGGNRHRAEMRTAQNACDLAYKHGELTHAHIFEEEAMEVLAEPDQVKLRAELIQVIALCVKWVEDIDKRPTTKGATR